MNHTFLRNTMDNNVSNDFQLLLKKLLLLRIEVLKFEEKYYSELSKNGNLFSISQFDEDLLTIENNLDVVDFENSLKETKKMNEEKLKRDNK